MFSKKTSAPTLRRTEDSSPKYESLQEIDSAFKRFSKKSDHNLKAIIRESYGFQDRRISTQSSESTMQTSRNLKSRSYQKTRLGNSASRVYENESGMSGNRPTSAKSIFPEDSDNKSKKRKPVEPKVVARVFGISVPPAIKSQGKQASTDFIISQMIEKLKKDLYDFSKRESRNKKPVDGDNSAVPEMNSMFSGDSRDILSWVKIHSQFKMLRKTAQTKLVEYISDELSFKDYDVKLTYDHKEKIDDYYDQLLEKVQNQGSRGKGDASSDTNQDGKIELPINYLMRRRVARDRQNKIIKEMEEVSNQKALLKDRVKTGHRKPETKVEWSVEKEREYRQNVKAAKGNFNNVVPSANFSDIGFQSSYTSIRKQSNLHNLRNFLLEKLQDSQWLSDSELRYLTYSSRLTNAVIPKAYYSEAVSKISSEVKEEIVSCIAEDILGEYEKIQDLLRQARMKFLRQKLNSDAQKLENFARKIEKENESLSRLIDLNKWRKSNWRFTEKRLAIWQEKMRAQEEQQSASRAGRPESSVPSMKHKPTTAGGDTNEVQRMIRERRIMSRNKFLKRNIVNHINSNALGLVTMKDMRHLQNPASKILKLPGSGAFTDPDTNQETQAEDIMQTMFDYKNTISRGMRGQGKTESYKKLYSGGPKSRQNDIPKIPSEKAATIIQKVWRGFYDRKIIRYLRNLPNKALSKLLRGGKDKKPIEEPKNVSKLYSNLIMLKNTLVNPQNEQKLVMRAMGEQLTKTQTAYNRKIDKEVREEIMKRQAKKNRFLLTLEANKPKNPDTIEEESSESQDSSSVKKPKKQTIYIKNNLHIKQIALLKACKENKTTWLKNLAYDYSKNDVNIADADGNCALYYACKNGNKLFVSYLLKKGALVNKKCVGNNTALHTAFMKKKANPNDYDFNNQLEIIKLLMAHGGDLDALNSANQTPIAFGSRRLLEFLHLSKGRAICLDRETHRQPSQRHFNRGLYFENCDNPPPPKMALYEMKRCSSASTMTNCPTIEHYTPDSRESLYDRRETILEKRDRPYPLDIF